ncbi:MAG: glycosyltransferase family 4 protein [Dysgonamonadaceae bacterium]|jgi:glycosyltransferase involved in cell wall biosynthesis|nr:glycosyltransferase family 4 protein [Dysgonamonadaceae bacterium]
MKILYDHQIFTIQNFGGISRYFSQIVSNLPDHVSTDISIRYSNNEYLNKLNKISPLETFIDPLEKFAFGTTFRGKKKIFNFMEKKFPNKYQNYESKNKEISIAYLKKQDFDIFHPTYYDDYFLEYIGNKPFVLTIHDMIHELYPEMINDTLLSIRKTHLAKKAAHIIAISENTKKDIIDILDVPEEKISIVYHASSLIEGKRTVNLPPNYFLYVGERKNYKNFFFFALSIEQILKNQKDIYVVCTGRPFDTNEIQFLTELNIRDNFISVFVKDEEMFNVYNQAIAFVFPSYYEGFGIPILEAFESSCPIILSDTSCFPEIAQDCALYFSPKNIKQLRQCLEKIIDDSSLKASLINKGKIRFRDFSWPDAANKTLDVYKRVLAGE